MAKGGDHSDEDSCCSDEEQVEKVEENIEEDTRSTAASRRSVQSSKSSKSHRRASQGSLTSLSSSKSGSCLTYSGKLPPFLKDRVKVSFVYPLESRHVCPSCEEVLRYPIVFEECGHRVCAHCFDTTAKITRKDNRKCPVDNSSIDVDAAAPDEKLNKEINELEVRCLTGECCKWEGEFQQILEHMDVCEHAEVLCANDCGERYQRKDTQKHVDKACPKQTIFCHYCGERHLREEKKEHMEDCLKMPLPCPNKCDKTIQIPREELDHHVDELCPRTKLSCAYANIGCTELYRRDVLSKHYKNAIVSHVKLIHGLVMKNKNHLDQHDAALGKHSEMIEEANKRIGYLERIARNTIIWRLDGYKRIKNEGAAVFSPTFYTSRHGYRLCASACLNGDGKGKGKYVSVFVSILKGAYDELLHWPFNHKVEITLLDQDTSDCKNHRQCCLSPNPCPENEPFLGKPKARKNASFGCSKLISHEEVEANNFIKNETLYIKIMVHCNADSEP